MNNKLPALTPESIDLTGKLEELQLEFTELFTRHKDMVEQESAILTSVYLEKLGYLLLELLEKQTKAAGLRMKMNLIQAVINRNETPDLLAIEKTIAIRLMDFYDRIKVQSSALDEAVKILSHLIPEEEARKLKEIFRVLCKRLHPDLIPDQTEVEKDLFIKVKAAYELQRLADLQEILLFLDKPDKQHLWHLTMDEKTERIKHLSKQIASLKEKIASLKEGFPFTIEKLIFDEVYISKKRIELELDIKVVEAEILKFTEIISLLCDE